MPAAQPRVVDIHGQIETGGLIKDDQAARINRVEADVGAVGALQQLSKLDLVINERQHHPLALAGFERLRQTTLRVWRTGLANATSQRVGAE